MQQGGGDEAQDFEGKYQQRDWIGMIFNSHATDKLQI